MTWLAGIGRFLLWMAAAALAAFAVFQFWFFVQILYWAGTNPERTRFMETRLEQMRQKDPGARLRHQWVDYERISVHLKRATIAAEDDRFLEHEGFDWEGIQQAMEKNQRRGRVVAGGSTISQQLAKNLFLSSERSLLRKGQEAIITAMLEMLLPKRRIFEIYLNVVEWGEGVFGAEAAARHYYGVGAASLDASQAARLAAMLPRPRYFDRNRGSPYLGRQAARIEARMRHSQVP